MYILEVLSGPFDGKTWTFDREISIGRDESLVTASITLDRYISRRHAHVREDGGRLFLTDLESRNGVQVVPGVLGLAGSGRLAQDESLGASVAGVGLSSSPVPCQAGVATVLAIGERFLVGKTLLRVVRS